MLSVKMPEIASGPSNGQEVNRAALKRTAVISKHTVPQTVISKAHQLRTPVIMPSYWTGSPALPEHRYTIDCAKYGLCAQELAAGGPLPVELAASMQATFDKVGLVVLSNTGLAGSTDAMRRCALEILGPNVMAEYRGGANARKKLSNVFETGAPAAAHLHYHHEMAYVSKSTKAVAFCCVDALPNDGSHRGATFVSEAVGHTDALMRTELGRKLKERGVAYVRCLTNQNNGESDDPDSESAVYNHWQTSFGTEDPDEAEALAKSRGLDVEWGSGGYMKTIFRCSAFEYFPHLDRNLLYSAVADDGIWFDSWPGVRNLPTMDSFSTATPEQRPLKILFGDGTEFSREELETYVRVYDQHGLPIDWEPGKIAVLCNYRWAHGRPSYKMEPNEKRTLGVVLGEMYDRVGQRDDKW